MKPDGWDRIFQDLEPMIMNGKNDENWLISTFIALSGNTNWHHPHFFAYFPTACSYPAIAADILSGGISSIGFTWVKKRFKSHKTELLGDRNPAHP